MEKYIPKVGDKFTTPSVIQLDIVCIYADDVMVLSKTEYDVREIHYINNSEFIKIE